jgi:hypothetical protein
LRFRCKLCDAVYEGGAEHKCRISKAPGAQKHGGYTADIAPIKAETAPKPTVAAALEANFALVGFREKLKEARLTQAEFARISGTPLRTVHDWAGNVSRTPPIAFAFLDLWLRSR